MTKWLPKHQKDPLDDNCESTHPVTAALHAIVMRQ